MDLEQILQPQMRELSGTLQVTIIFENLHEPHTSCSKGTQDISFLTNRLGIYDGCELLAYVIGGLLSSPVNRQFGNYGTYVVCLVLCSLSVTYMIFFIKEPKKHRVVILVECR